jgi:hypothetical protein
MKECVEIDAPVLNLKIQYKDEIYRLGIASDFDQKKGGFFDTVFFVAGDVKKPWDNGLNYRTLDDFWQAARLGDVFMADIKDDITILEEEDVGCPSNITMLIPYIVEVEKS